MTIDKAKLEALAAKLNSMPEDATLPENIFADLSQEGLVAVYVEKMIYDKGVEATDELRNKLFNELSDEITKQMILAMPDYLVKKLNEDIDGGADDEAINKAIDESGIDVETITEQTMSAFREKFLNGEDK